MRMTPEKRLALIRELFGTGSGSVGVSYLRVSIGSSDMNDHVFTYDDLSAGESDLALKHFSLGPDLTDVVPVLQQILKIDPGIKILGTPWSAPSWMKTNENPKGGSLKPEFYDVYARYLAKYVEQMGKLGIRIDAITPQNEPLNPKNTPSMVMTADEEDAFIKQSLGPVFHKSSLPTKIIIYDHNCDRPDYPLTILADPAAAQYVDGSGFHLYGGATEAMTQVHDAYPDKNIYFTEQMVIDDPKRGPDLRAARPVQEIVIGAISNWSRNVLLWNLAADPNFGPHTSDGGCPVCEGAITLDGDKVTRNVAYYTIAQVSKFVRPGAVRVASTSSGGAPQSVAFAGKDGRIVLLVSNPTDSPLSFSIRFHGKAAQASLPAGAVATFAW
jgi:glucosylceramidase